MSEDRDPDECAAMVREMVERERIAAIGRPRPRRLWARVAALSNAVDGVVMVVWALLILAGLAYGAVNNGLTGALAGGFAGAALPLVVALCAVFVGYAISVAWGLVLALAHAVIWADRVARRLPGWWRERTGEAMDDAERERWQR